MITTLLLLAAMGQAVPSDCNIATCPCTYSGTPSVPTSATVEFVAIGELRCKEGQHIESNGKGENHCVDDAIGEGSLRWVNGPGPSLKCPKYEHIETFYSKKFILEDRCVPDIHVLYEKDWQDVLERLKKLEDGKR